MVRWRWVLALDLRDPWRFNLTPPYDYELRPVGGVAVGKWWRSDPRRYSVPDGQSGLVPSHCSSSNNNNNNINSSPVRGLALPRRHWSAKHALREMFSPIQEFFLLVLSSAVAEYHWPKTYRLAVSATSSEQRPHLISLALSSTTSLISS